MKFPIEMYRIREEEMKIQIPCERCLGKGIIDRTCSKCGGKGVHNKTIKVWKIAPKTVTVEKIDRSPNDNFYRGNQTSYKNGLRYWTSPYDFYNEADMYLHFTISEAQRECDKRNDSIKELLEIKRKSNLVDSKATNDDNLVTLLNSLAELDYGFVYYLSCNNRSMYRAEL